MSLSRVRALAVLGGLLLVAVIVVTWAVIHDRQTGPLTKAKDCPKGYVLVSLKQPPPQDIKINVYNGTEQVGLATNVGSALGDKKFKVLKTDNDPKRKSVKGVVELRYGPQMVGAAQVLRGYFLTDNDTLDEFDPARADDVVDVVVGAGFRQLGSPTEVNQKIGALGDPELPAGTCQGK